VIRSSDPNDPPLIDPNYLSTSEDIANLRKAIQVGVSLMSTEGFTSIGAEYVVFKPCAKYGIWSNEYINCLIRAKAFSFVHYCCTAKIGQDPLSGAVVDERLKVYGVDGLRVVDASVMPSIVQAATNPTVMVIGEKGADMIKQDNGI